MQVGYGCLRFTDLQCC